MHRPKERAIGRCYREAHPERDANDQRAERGAEANLGGARKLANERKAVGDPENNHHRLQRCRHVEQKLRIDGQRQHHQRQSDNRDVPVNAERGDGLPAAGSPAWKNVIGDAGGHREREAHQHRVRPNQFPPADLWRVNRSYEPDRQPDQQPDGREPREIGGNAVGISLRRVGQRGRRPHGSLLLEQLANIEQEEQSRHQGDTAAECDYRVLLHHAAGKDGPSTDQRQHDHRSHHRLRRPVPTREDRYDASVHGQNHREDAGQHRERDRGFPPGRMRAGESCDRHGYRKRGQRQRHGRAEHPMSHRLFLSGCRGARGSWRHARPDLRYENDRSGHLQSSRQREQRQRAVTSMSRSFDRLGNHAAEESDIERSHSNLGKTQVIPDGSLWRALARQQPIGNSKRKLQKPADEKHMPMRRLHPQAPATGNLPVHQHQSTENKSAQQPQK